MSLRDFWISVRTAAGLVSSSAAVDSPRLDADRIERILRSTDLWLTRSAVEGYDPADFQFLTEAERKSLDESVEKFRKVASQVPSNAPASPRHIQAARPEFQRVLSIIRPDKYADPEALVIGKRVEQLVGGRLPPWVKEMVFETGSDANGDPALWIWVEVDDKAVDESTLRENFKLVRRELEDALGRIGTGRWPYIRLRLSSEQRPTEKAKTKK